MRYSILFVVFCINLSIGALNVNAQIFPKIIKKNNTTHSPAANQERKNIELRTFDQDSYLRTLTSVTDSIIFENNVNLGRVRSIISEDRNIMIWAPTNQLIKVSEQIQIDSIWVTAFEYYSSWDSNKIDIYDFDPKTFVDTVNIKLYDEFFGYNWKMPLETTPVTSPYGYRWRRWHYGTDLDLNTGDPVYSGFDGIVRIKSFDRYGYGFYIVVRHKNGLETLYGHLSKQLVDIGQEVKAGELIALGGNTGKSTGSHLHYELRYRGLPFDAEKVYDFSDNKILNQNYQITPSLFGNIIQAKSAPARTTATHKVKKGENLGSIARKYGVSVSSLTRLNGISTRTVLRIGQNLRIK
ncbi:murein DD-endopeptidase MepM/ murein hydrolase activator NlpD [Algoriphagus ratkowskyi]|uniref:Murein DD-endopeptidase MepM/ murein hydrolase activator NlpD n=1 Tax=Algoriphagus ratkowskyi TaxID=57028 RepID=A0A2W7RF06_9BACT|nr:peptidoglycan DD-metalloendopeptidase family protein [Algoriphagus ratkowskyi]PZX56970.1 murein DD-endopeptidase MepM/ murein hydrolase activator NlpD [Algoriphagus ratkowskyi]TXD79878.1 peptidoglycan DD-metalloendopeptidase family protein [Algoriphagus ratkowskyi]